MSLCERGDTSENLFGDSVLHCVFGTRRYIMNWDQIKGSWKQIKGKVREKWGKLTDDDLTSVAGKKDQLAGKIQERYGVEKERAEKEIDEWVDKLNTKPY
jgi:uncharacterized protein YjbJ (UPF0337 family)